MIIIQINNDYTVELTEKTEPDLIDHIKTMIHFGIWTPETSIQAIENNWVIDSGKIEDFFNIN